MTIRPLSGIPRHKLERLSWESCEAPLWRPSAQHVDPQDKVRR